MRGVLPVVISAFAVPFCACPNDTRLTLAAGGLVPLKSTQIAMDSEDLEISVHRVTVTYRFRNQTNTDVDATVGFPLPALDGGDFYNVPVHLPSKDPLNFVALKVTVTARLSKQKSNPAPSTKIAMSPRACNPQVYPPPLPQCSPGGLWHV
jgi:hypothetical protein